MLLLFVPNFNTTSVENVLFINLPVTAQINHCGTLECQFQGNITEKAIYLKSGKWNSKMQPIPTGPFLSFPLRSSQIRPVHRLAFLMM